MRKKELKESCFYWYEKYEEIYFKYSIEKHENNNLRQENKELKSVINDIKHILNNQMDYRGFVDIVNDIEEILERGEI